MRGDGRRTERALDQALKAGERAKTWFKKKTVERHLKRPTSSSSTFKHANCISAKLMRKRVMHEQPPVCGLITEELVIKDLTENGTQKGLSTE